MNDLEKLQKKLTAQKFRKEVADAKHMKNSQETQNNFNDEMVRKTWLYQKKYGFEINPREKHEFWNVEADAIKKLFC